MAGLPDHSEAPRRIGAGKVETSRSMAKNGAGIFDGDDALDLSGFAPKTGHEPNGGAAFAHQDHDAGRDRVAFCPGPV